MMQMSRTATRLVIALPLFPLPIIPHCIPNCLHDRIVRVCHTFLLAYLALFCLIVFLGYTIRTFIIILICTPPSHDGIDVSFPSSLPFILAGTQDLVTIFVDRATAGHIQGLLWLRQLRPCIIGLACYWRVRPAGNGQLQKFSDPPGHQPGLEVRHDSF